MRNYDDCVFDMICPSCGIDLNQYSNNTIKMVEEVGYTVEYTVLGLGYNGEIDIDKRDPYISDEEVYERFFQCNNCGAELPSDFVDALIARWKEVDEESEQEIEEESKANLG